MESFPTVFVIDDDEYFVRALDRLLRAEGFSTRTWTSANKFLAEHDPALPGCLVTDLIMPEMSGLELQRNLLAQGCVRPVVFLTGRGDMATAVEGMKLGAVSFLPKPVSRDLLVETLREALSKDASARVHQAEQQRVVGLLNSVTPREAEVLELVARGRLNKQIAVALGIAEKTVKVHRGRIMQKMQVKSAAALVQVMKNGGPLHNGQPRDKSFARPILPASDV
jgi:FixJ family two-component response regulator